MPRPFLLTSVAKRIIRENDRWYRPNITESNICIVHDTLCTLKQPNARNEDGRRLSAKLRTLLDSRRKNLSRLSKFVSNFLFFFFLLLSFQPPSKYRANYSTRSFNSGTTVHYMNRIYPRLYVRWVMAGVHHRGGACIWRRATVCMCLVSRYKKNNFLRVADQNVVTRTLQVKKREREREIGLRTER